MCTILTHAILGAGAYRLAEGPQARSEAGAKTAAVLAMLPDADVAFMRWIPYEAPFGHRGFSHSLFCAALLGLGGMLFLRRRAAIRGGAPVLWLLLAAVTASHGFLDAMTDGGEGIAFFAPFDNTRRFLPFTPIPVSPLGLDLLSPYLLQVIVTEALMLWPLAVAMGTARQALPAWRRGIILAALAGSAVLWVLRLGG